MFERWRVCRYCIIIAPICSSDPYFFSQPFKETGWQKLQRLWRLTSQAEGTSPSRSATSPITFALLIQSESKMNPVKKSWMDICCYLLTNFFYFCLSWKGFTWTVASAIAPPSPPCGLWKLRCATSPKSLPAPQELWVSWPTTCWRGGARVPRRKLPSCSRCPTTTTYTRTGWPWESTKRKGRPMRVYSRRCTMTTSRPISCGGSLMAGASPLRAAMWTSCALCRRWAEPSWRSRCGTRSSLIWHNSNPCRFSIIQVMVILSAWAGDNWTYLARLINSIRTVQFSTLVWCVPYV